jgi:hypothetical protein
MSHLQGHGMFENTLWTLILAYWLAWAIEDRQRNTDNREPEQAS